MKIALIGYGKMGRMIEQIALSRGHEIVAKIDVDNHDDLYGEAFKQADVAIEFTTPSTAFNNCAEAMKQGVKVVCGSTGWLASLPELKEICSQTGSALFQSTNFSIGMNIFMAVNRRLASMMNAFNQYTPSMTEIHHIHKKDHPSGTAITLAEELMASHPSITEWECIEKGVEKEMSANVLPIAYGREGEVPGYHAIKWDSAVDTIEISHNAKSREGFALGAVVAAEWLKDKTGFYEMKDMLGLE
jgi:4-hydroxy-tetrahydrodipicolinate reductase